MSTSQGSNPDQSEANRKREHSSPELPDDVNILARQAAEFGPVLRFDEIGFQERRADTERDAARLEEIRSRVQVHPARGDNAQMGHRRANGFNERGPQLIGWKEFNEVRAPFVSQLCFAGRECTEHHRPVKFMRRLDQPYVADRTDHELGARLQDRMALRDVQHAPSADECCIPEFLARSANRLFRIRNSQRDFDGSNPARNQSFGDRHDLLRAVRSDDGDNADVDEAGNNFSARCHLMIFRRMPRFARCAKNGFGGTIFSGACTPEPVISPAAIIRATIAGGAPVFTSGIFLQWQSRVIVLRAPLTIVRTISYCRTGPTCSPGFCDIATLLTTSIGFTFAPPTEIGSCDANPMSRKNLTRSRNTGSNAILKLTSFAVGNDLGSVATSEWMVYIGCCKPRGAGSRIRSNPDMGGTNFRLPLVNTAGWVENSSRIVCSE